ncbi:hypothetical protein VE00_07063 [Pseudogymnoascus sp. WSF 3629]|nr:hypothetical protein VE00_07063 [Pseudogymnoascus sp. WSF 3629]
MGKKFNKTHQSPSNVRWSDDEQTIYYLGQPVELAKIETMCDVLVRELRELLMVLTFDSPVETIDLERTIDSMAWSQAFRRQGFSFIDHVQNQDQVKGDYRNFWRHVAIGIATRHLMRASKTWEKENEDAEDGDEEFAEGDDEEELELDTFRHIMSGHGRRVAQAHYAIDGAFLHRLGPELVTAYEQASIAWHGLWKMTKKGDQGFKGAGHRREASQALVSRPIKRERIDMSDQALIGLQRIYHDSHAKPRSEGQAAALELMHHPSPTRPLVIVLPTSSGKSALFFSVAAMTRQQTVVVVVPFAALVDDIVSHGEAAGLNCEEWINEQSGHELQQLIVVSADRAVEGGFRHYAKGLELEGQLAHVFFRRVPCCIHRHIVPGAVARVVDVTLEDVLKERLCIENAMIFRRNTARKTIRYQVRDSKDEAPSEIAIKYVQQVTLSAGSRGVIYVRSYDTGGFISKELKCPFYRAKADDKGAVLQQWIGGEGGWIVATGALGTGINIEGIVRIIHIGRPYGLTRFVQQSGRGGRNGEISESVIITRVESSSGWKRREIMMSLEAKDGGNKGDKGDKGDEGD